MEFDATCKEIFENAFINLWHYSTKVEVITAIWKRNDSRISLNIRFFSYLKQNHLRCFMGL